MSHLRLVTDEDNPAPVTGAAPQRDSDVPADVPSDDPATPVVPIRLLLALSGRCDCVECCAVELARRAGRPWVHPALRTPAPELRAVR